MKPKIKRTRTWEISREVVVVVVIFYYVATNTRATLASIPAPRMSRCCRGEQKKKPIRGDFKNMWMVIAVLGWEKAEEVEKHPRKTLTPAASAVAHYYVRGNP